MASDGVLTAWSMGLVFASFYFQKKAFELLGLPRIAALIGLAILSHSFR